VWIKYADIKQKQLLRPKLASIPSSSIAQVMRRFRMTLGHSSRLSRSSLTCRDGLSDTINALTS
jgi:hypothetical protein